MLRARYGPRGNEEERAPVLQEAVRVSSNRSVVFLVLCALFAVAVLAIALTTGSIGFASLVPVPSPPPVPTPTPSVPCVYSDWSSWSIQCLEYPPGEWFQVRSQGPIAPATASACPQLLERQACALDSCLQFNTSVYTVGCTYDPFSNLCNNSGWLLDVNWYCVTNSSLSSLESYYASQFTYGVIYFSFGVIYPCLPECPPSNASATPVPYPAPSPAPSPTPLPECDYTNITDWSDTCLEYPPDTYSQVRYEYADPPYSHCPPIETRKNCSAYTCNDLMVIRTQTIGCGYSSETNLCTGSTRTNSTATYCATNATNLTNYLAETGYIDGGGVLEFGLPCLPQCAVSNGTVIPPSPSPDGGSPTPSIACTYGAWSEWSSQCLEYPAGVFEQVRTRIPVEPYSFCSATSERQNCSIASCWTYDTVQISIGCQYSPAGNCNSSSTTTTTTTVCATNTTDYEAYDAYVGPGAVNVTTSTPVQPCVDLCPPTNYSDVPSPTPTPAPSCTYGEWGAWSSTCLEFPTGTYFQQRTRVSTAPTLTCTELLQKSDCVLLICSRNTFIQSNPVCDDYDTQTGECVSSMAYVTSTTACFTNATNLADYLSQPMWEVDIQPVARITPCSPSCPLTNGEPPVPAPVPSPSVVPCVYNSWSLWSFTCPELPPDGAFFQYRTRTPVDSSASCADLVQLSPCDPERCQTIMYRDNTTLCYYDIDGNCDTATVTVTDREYCLTNATDVSIYRSLVASINTPVSSEDEDPCPLQCPATGPGGDVIEVIDITVLDVDLTSFFVCLPPLYPSLAIGCDECANTSACTKGYLDPQQLTCTQVSACDDNDACTVDTCDEDTGLCLYAPVQGKNEFNASVQCLCTVLTADDSSVTCAPIDPDVDVPELLAGPGCSGGETNATHICGYNEVIQRCQCILRPLVVPVTTTTSSDCVAAAYSGPDTALTVPLYIFNDEWVCPSDDGVLRVCLNDTCTDALVAIDPGRCDYQVLDESAERGGFFYRTVYDDSRCAVTFGGMNYSTCSPAFCAHTLTGCAQCPFFYTQALLQYPVDCACCETYADCDEGFTCLPTINGDQCRPVAEALLGTCLSDADCFTLDQCQPVLCNTTQRQCYVSARVECEQLEDACVATYRCEPATGNCIRNVTVCTDNDVCTTDYCEAVAPGEPECSFVNQTADNPVTHCTMEVCDPLLGWSVIPRPCDGAEECVEGQGCQSLCTADANCTGLNNPFSCIVGQCVGGVCMERTSCSTVQSCSGGFCVSAGCSAPGPIVCGAGLRANTLNTPSCPCVCDAPTCNQLVPPNCTRYACSANGSVCELQPIVCDDGNDCTTDPPCNVNTNACPIPIFTCIAEFCEVAECGNNNTCVIRELGCTQTDNATVGTCDQTCEYVFSCDDGDLCTADSVNPNTSACVNVRDPTCCTQNSHCVSASCDLTTNRCDIPPTERTCFDEGETCAPLGIVSSNPEDIPCYADYFCHSGVCVYVEPIGLMSCVRLVCGTNYSDDSYCSDQDPDTADFCSVDQCSESLTHCRHCPFINQSPYETIIDFSSLDCTCD
jgi:hypothetical protein